jgi:exopolysaccharide biosynthesis protein
MAEYKLSYTASAIDTKLGKIDNAVFFSEQTLTEEQQAQARANIGAASDKNALEIFLDNVDVDYAYDETTGAYYTVVRIYKQKIDGSYQYPFVYAPNGSGSGDKSTYDMTHGDGWLLAINAGVFNTSNCKPDGIVIQNGVVIQNSPTATHSQNKPMTIDRNGNFGYASYNADADELATSGVVSAVCGFMPIVVNYEIVPASEWNSVSHYTQNAQRQIIGQWGNGDYAIITCEGRGYHNSDGWTIAEAQAVCVKHGLKFAYNLDGGGSTETMLGLKPINTIYEGTTGRIVPTFIVFNGTNSFNGDTNEIVQNYTYLNYMSVPTGAYINTGIPETSIYSAEYKVINENWDNTSGHILSSANSYYPFMKRHPNYLDNETYADCSILCFKMQGTEKEAYNESIHIDGVDQTLEHTVFMNYDGLNVTAYLDGTLVDTITIGDTKSANNKYYLFAYGGNPTATRYQFTGKVYYLKLWNVDGILVHDYRPVVRNTDGVYGLYDEVTGIFYESDSNIAFTA